MGRNNDSERVSDYKHPRKQLGVLSKFTGNKKIPLRKQKNTPYLDVRPPLPLTHLIRNGIKMKKKFV